MKNNPNIIVVLADDMGFSDIGCFGSEIYTPNIDSMAENGLRYTQMYNNARCCPSRAALLTGLYPHQSGVGHMVTDTGIPEYSGYLNERCLSLAEGAKLAGYRTGMIGKWHVGGDYGRNEEAFNKFGKNVMGQKGYPTPMQRGFDRFYGTLEGAGNYYNPITLMEDGEWITVKSEDNFYYTEKIGEKSCEYIEEFAADNKPFFLYVAFNAVHWPLHARESDIAKYEGKYLDGWDCAREKRYRKQVEMGIVQDIWSISPRDDDAPDWGSVEDPAREDIKMAVYAAQVESMDRAVGEILNKLRCLGIEGETLIMFMSDNGACAEEVPDGGWIYKFASEKTLDGRDVEVGNSSHRRPGGEDTFMSYGLPWANLSNTPFRLFKHWIHEGGIATPLVVQWENNIIEPGRILHTPIHFIDILPTLLEASGAEYPESYNDETLIPVCGESFLASFNGEWERQRPIFWEHEGNCGVRIGKYKLVRKYPSDFELYDIERDRTELHDISSEEPEISNGLKDKYYSWAKRMNIRNWDEMEPVLRDCARNRKF